MKNTKFIFIKFLILVMAFFVKQSMAQETSCRVESSPSYYQSWEINDLPKPIYNGFVVATMYTYYKIDYFNSSGIEINSLNLNTLNPDGIIEEGFPMPGVGLRISLDSLRPAAGNSVQLTPPISPEILPQGGYVKIASGSWSDGNLKVERSGFVYFKIEVVVTDAVKYQGGSVNLAGTSLLSNVLNLLIAYTGESGEGTIACDPTVVWLNDSVLGTPQLPVPPKPSCSFSNFDQVVTLPPAPASQIPEYGSAYTADPALSKPFTIKTGVCDKKTSFSIFFSDQNDASDPGREYLTLQGNFAGKAGIRIFHDNEIVQYGPTYHGSTQPSHKPAIVQDPIEDGSSQSYTFHAEYVRLHGVKPHELPTGPVNASSLVTVIYP